MKEKELRELLREREGISTLNPMQERMLQGSSEKRDLILLSPTGSGKTVAFALPMLKMLRDPTGRVQAVIIAPSRELVLQIAGVVRNIGRDFRVVAVYGGHNVEDEVNSLSVVPDVVVGTPGRLLDHAKRGNIDLMPVRILVLDEFDKSLELGFETDMKKIVGRMKNVSRTMLTSATDADMLPEFLNLTDPIKLDFLTDNARLRRRMRVRHVRSEGKDKLDSLLALLRDIAGNSDDGKIGRTIVFANHRESAERIADFLRKSNVSVALYSGELDQHDRQTALALFNSGARPVLVATDLAARGLDIRDVRNVIHYHQPLTEQAYTHRNGRTARVDDNGDVYLLLGPDEEMREYVSSDGEYRVDGKAKGKLNSDEEVVHISAGRREKLSRGDILGFLTKTVGIEGSRIGRIEVFDHYSLATVPAEAVPKILTASRMNKIKGEKQKFTVVK